MRLTLLDLLMKLLIFKSGLKLKIKWINTKIFGTKINLELLCQLE